MVPDITHFSDFRTHQNCLRKLREAKKERKISECDVQTSLAVHLFGPLVVNSKVIADDQSYNKGSPKCINCDQTVETGNTSIGKQSLLKIHLSLCCTNHLKQLMGLIGESTNF